MRIVCTCGIAHLCRVHGGPVPGGARAFLVLSFSFAPDDRENVSAIATIVAPAPRGDKLGHPQSVGRGRACCGAAAAHICTLPEGRTTSSLVLMFIAVSSLVRYWKTYGSEMTSTSLPSPHARQCAPRSGASARAAPGAHEGLALVRAVEQPVLHEEGAAVREQSVALHLAQPDTAVHLAPVDGLPRERVDRPARAHLVLVRDHVAQPLVVDDAHEDVHFHLRAVDARVELLRAVVRVARRAQLLAKVVGGVLVLVEAEGRRVLRDAVHGAGLARHALEQHADGHARGEAVRVEEDVGDDARLREGHVFARPQPRHDTLLPVPRRELVAGHRVTVVPQLDARALARGVLALGAEQAHLLHHGVVGVLVLLGRVPAGFIILDHLPHLGHAVGAELLLEELPPLVAALRRPGLRLDVAEAVGEWLARLLEVVEVDDRVGVHRGVREAAVVRRLVDDHRVLHVVARVRDDRHHGVGARGVLVEAVALVVAVAHDGALRRVQRVGLGVGAMRLGVERCAHGLLAHLALVHVARRLVEVGEGREARDEREDVRRLELAVRALAGLDVLLGVGHAQRRLLERADARRAAEEVEAAEAARAVDARHQRDLHVAQRGAHGRAAIGGHLGGAQRGGGGVGDVEVDARDDDAVEDHWQVLRGRQRRARGQEHGACLRQDRRHPLRHLGVRHEVRRDVARGGDVVEQAARPAVGRVHGTEEAPRVGQQLAHGGRAELHKEGSSVDGAEVGDVAPKVEPLARDDETGGLLQVEPRLAHQVARGEEVGELPTDVDDLGLVEADAEAAQDLVGVDEPLPLRRALAVAQLLAHGGAQPLEVLLQLLLEDHLPQVARQQHLLVDQRVGVVLAHAPRRHGVDLVRVGVRVRVGVGVRVKVRVKVRVRVRARVRVRHGGYLLQHEEEQLPLLRVPLLERASDVHEHVSSDEELAHLDVAQPRGRAQHRPELGAKEGEALRARVQRLLVVCVLAQRRLHPVGDEVIARVAAACALVDLGVGALPERLEQQHERDEVLRLADRQPQPGAAAREQVQPHGERGVVLPRAADDRGKGRELGAAVPV
eukprot:scaffold106242_cov63-Phaeocystis_antarctica.AAC.8